MTKVQEVQLLATVARQNPRFLEWLKNRLDAEKSALVTVADNEQFKRLQGRAQFCAELVKLLESAAQS